MSGRIAGRSPAAAARAASENGLYVDGFFNDTRKDVHRPTEAPDAWRRPLDLFATDLKR